MSSDDILPTEELLADWTRMTHMRGDVASQAVRDVLLTYVAVAAWGQGMWGREGVSE